MKIRFILLSILLFFSCSSIKNVEDNNGSINIGDSNFIFTSPDKSRNYSRQEIEIQKTNLRNEIEIIDKTILEIQNNQESHSRSADKKKEIIKLEKRKTKHQKLLDEWEKLTQ